MAGNKGECKLSDSETCKALSVDLDELKKLSLEATKGPWVARDYGNYDGTSPHWYIDTGHDLANYVSESDNLLAPNHWDDKRAERDLKFIAAANPAVILALIAEIEELRKKDN